MSETRCAVVIATRNRPAELRRALEALAAQTHPAELTEVIVVDDGSSPAVRTDELPSPGGGPVRLVRLDGDGPAAARNAGAEVADGAELVLFSDDDAVASARWVAEMVAAHGEASGAAIGGPSVPLAPDNPYSRAYEAIEEAVRRAHDRHGRPHLAAANLALPAARLSELGGFDPRYGVSEDRDLVDRWVARGWPALWHPEAVVAHAHPETLGSFWRTFVAYGRGAHRFHRGHSGDRSPGGWRISAETLVQAFRGARSVRQVLLVSVWLLATVSGFTLGVLRRRPERPSPPSP